MYAVFMALKYLLRRRITLVAVLVTALGVMVMVIVVSVIRGYISKVEEVIRGNTADLTIEMPSGEPIGEIDKKIRAIKNVPHVTACSPIVRRFVIISYAGVKYDYCLMNGIDPVSEKDIGKFKSYFKDNVDLDTIFSAEKNPGYNPILIGESVIQTAGFGVGSEVSLTAPRSIESKPGGITTEHFKVIELTHSGGYDIDSRQCYVPISVARRMLGLKDDEATHIKVQIDDPRYYSQVTLEIANAVTGSTWHNADGDEAQFDANTAIDFPPYRITPWRAAKQNELSAAENDLRILSFIVVFIMLGAGFVLLAILVMMVFEKRKDIGIMKSVGSTWLGTVSIFLMMGLIIGMAGTGVGLLLGKLASDNINGIASTVEKVSGVKVFSAEIYKLDKIPAEFNWRSAAWISAMALGVSLLSSCFAAIRAAVIDPVKALRYE